MRNLVSGYTKFREEVYPDHKEHFARLANAQNPETLFITCADSRIEPSLLLQTKPGDLFICRNAGNIVPAHGDRNGGVSATIEYAASVLKVRNIIVCGHSDCGVMRGLLHPDKVAKLEDVSRWLRFGARAQAIVNQTCDDGYSEHDKMMEMARQNVLAQLDHLRTHPAVAAAMVSRGLQLHGWMYNIEHGEIQAWCAEQKSFLPLETFPIREPELAAV